jgi:phosphoglycolate phosphatase-like HAD superfamily hydrolase
MTAPVKPAPKPCIIFDLDGTLADCEHRLHHIQKDPKDWTSFFAACGDDKPIDHMLKIMWSLGKEYEIFIVSGVLMSREETIEWLT